MERSKKVFKEKEVKDLGEFVFQNAFGNPVIFDSEPSKANMKANTWGKVKDTNTALYVRFSDGGAIKITGTELT